MDAEFWDMSLDLLPNSGEAELKYDWPLDLEFDYLPVLGTVSPPEPSPIATDDEESSTESSRFEEPDAQLVSRTFLPQNKLLDSDPDLILRSSDKIHFFVHSSLLRSEAVTFITSSETEEGLPIFGVEDHSNVLNVILHTVYGMSCAQFNHDFSEIARAVDCLPSYGVQPGEIITPSHALYDLIISLSPLYPLDAYTLAAHHGMEVLAVTCSSRLLSLSLDSLSDEAAASIGPIYLKRLLLLQHQRRQALCEMLTRQIRPHPRTPGCDYSRQQSVSRAWTLAAATFVLDPLADTSNQQLQSTFGTLMPLIECDDCRRLVEKKLKDIITTWSTIKTTI